MPGHTVFENDEAYTTLSPSSIDSIVGWSSPAKRSSTYGSSSNRRNPWRSASSISRRRFSSDSVQPAGLWKLGIMWASLGRAPPSSAASSALTSMPSASSGMASSSAPIWRSASSVRSYVGASTTTRSPGSTTA